MYYIVHKPIPGFKIWEILSTVAIIYSHIKFTTASLIIRKINWKIKCFDKFGINAPEHPPPPPHNFSGSPHSLARHLVFSVYSTILCTVMYLSKFLRVPTYMNYILNI